MVQIMPGLVLHRIRSIMDTHQVREYPDSTISKVLIVLKWRMITTLNKKLLEKHRVQNLFASYEVHIGQFLYNVNATVSLTLSKFRFKIFHRTDKLRTKLTDGKNQLLNLFGQGSR